MLRRRFARVGAVRRAGALSAGFACVVVLAALAIAWCPGTAGARATTTRQRGCQPSPREVVGRRGAAVVFRHPIGNGEYGTAYRYYGCVDAAQRPRRLYDGGEQFDITLLHPVGGDPVFRGPFVAWAEEEPDLECDKSGELCPAITSVEAWNLRTGRRLCSSVAIP